MTAIKKPFLRVTEVWTPSRDSSRLELAQGQYGQLTDFATATMNTSFALGEGLPGRAWELGHPVVLHDLTRPQFLREESARAAGLTSGVAVPVRKGGETLAVLVMFCGDDQEHIGAIEVWHAPPGSNELALADGYFGTASKFAFQSKHIRLRMGFGLPGMAWENGKPVIMGDLGRTKRFIRRDSAETSGITRGLCIPLQADAQGVWLLAILSALGTPIASRFETWSVEDDGSAMTFDHGICESGQDLARAYSDLKIVADSSALGRTLGRGIPILASAIDVEAPEIRSSCSTAGLTRIVTFPVYKGAKLSSIVAWYS